MSVLHARALYDFEGDPSGNELSFLGQEVLTILRQDIGDGWWEAQNVQGQKGLVPEAYLEITSVPEPSIPPPPPPTYNIPPPPSATSSWRHSGSDQHDQWAQQSTNGGWSAAVTPSAPPPQSSWSNVPAAATQPATNYSQPASQNNQTYGTNDPQLQRDGSYDDWDDDWDDDDESVTSEQVQGPGGSTRQIQLRERSSSDSQKTGTVRNRFNRFSVFSKQGGEAFLLGIADVNVPKSECRSEIIDMPEGPQWKPIDLPYTCMITSPKKESKLKGLKSFIAYQLTPSFSNIQVSRRYKHFDWLHERLVEKFATIAVPPLPDKQISGRYEDDFINERMRQLQMWMDRMAKHPIISHSEVFTHFLSCTDMKKWKLGKRRAEKDDFMGGKFFLTITTPSARLEIRDVENRVEHFGKFSKHMDDGVKHLSNVLENHGKKQQGPFKKEFQKIGTAFLNLGDSFQMDHRPQSDNLTKAVHHTGRTYETIGMLFEEQPRYDIHPMVEGLWEYKGILSTFPDIIQVHKSAMFKVHDCQRLYEEDKMAEEDAKAVAARSDVMSYACLAEMNNFQHHRVIDFNERIKSYLQNQITFYKKITAKLEETLSMYEDTS